MERQEAEERNKIDFSILKYFDTKPSLEPLDNIYQIPIIYPTPYPLGFKGQIAGAVYSRMRPNERFKVNVKGIFTPVENSPEYLKEFLEYHFNHYTGDKNDFVNKLRSCIVLGSTVYGEVDQYSHFKALVDNWLSNKENLINNDKAIRIKRNSAEISKPLFKEGYEPDVYLNMLKDAKPKVINDKGEFIKGPKGRKAPVVAWIDFLDRKGIINSNNDESKAKLLMDLIPNFVVDSRSLRNEKTSTSKAYIHYSSEFITLFNMI